MERTDSAGEDPRRAWRIAKRVASRWLRKSGCRSINGMDSDDIAQETILALLRNGSSFQYTNNKARFVVFDAIRNEVGNRRVGQRSINMQGSALMDAVQPSRSETQSVEAFIQMILSSDRLSLEAKCIAVMRLQGKSFRQISLMLGVSASRVSQLKFECAKELHEFLGEKMSESLAKHIHDRILYLQEYRKRTKYQRHTQVNRASSPSTSPSS